MRILKQFLAPIVSAFLLVSFSLISCQSVSKTIKQATTQKGLTDKEITVGLKEALKVGTGNAVKVLNKKDGYFRDAAVKILFPPDVAIVEQKLRQIPGGGSIVDEFVETMNRGAEDASSQAVNIFVGSITSMTIDDAKGILFGSDTAATAYFKRKTTDGLVTAYRPKIQSSLDKVNATSIWKKTTETYNKIPGVNKVETDIVRYVTDRALSGLFSKVEIEERKIRKEPVARINDILKQVFGELDKK